MPSHKQDLLKTAEKRKKGRNCKRERVNGLTWKKTSMKAPLEGFFVKREERESVTERRV